MIKHNFASFSDNISKWETPQLTERDGAEPEEEKDLETLRKEAFKQGYADGLQQGTQQGQHETARQLQTLEALLDAMARPFDDINQQALDSLAVLAGKIARCLVKRELHTAPESILALVRDTVSILNSGAEKINVHLNPADAALIQSITRSGAEKSRWKLIDDPLVPRGDCRVQSRDSVVDGSLMARINTIITQFQGDERA